MVMNVSMKGRISTRQLPTDENNHVTLWSVRNAKWRRLYQTRVIVTKQYYHEAAQPLYLPIDHEQPSGILELFTIFPFR